VTLITVWSLNDQGETVDSLYLTGVKKEMEEALVDGYTSKSSRLEGQPGHDGGT
jgi:hypothetical protein